MVNFLALINRARAGIRHVLGRCTRWRLAPGLLLLSVVLTANGSPALTINTPDDAQTARIGVMTGSLGELLISGRFPRAQIQRFDDIMDAVAAMKAGHLDAVVSTLPTLYQVVKKHPDLRVLPETLDQEDTSVAVHKGDAALLQAVNQLISDLLADGTLAQMRARWIKQDAAPYAVVHIPEAASGTPLRVGVAATREPLSFIQDGQVTGHDGELARRIGARLGRPVVFVDLKFMALIPALQARRIDLIVSGMTGTPERSKSVDFSRSYFQNAQGMLVRAGPQSPSTAPPTLAALAAAPPAPSVTPAPPQNTSSLPDFAGQRVGTQLGTVYDLYAIANFPKATVVQYHNFQDLALAVSTGKVDVGLSDIDTLAEVMHSHAELAPLGKPIFTSPVAAGFAKSQGDLRTAFNEFLASIRANGVYADMVARWMTQRSTKMPDLPQGPTNGTLTVGVSSGGFPFNAVQNNESAGFDIELATRFAAHLGRELRLSDQEFGSLIAALVSGKVDVIIADMFITPERQQKIDFSEPYFTQDSVIFSRTSPPTAAAATADEPAPEGFMARLAASFYNNIIREQRYLLLWNGLQSTVIISILATLFGTALGGLICFMRMSPRALLEVPARLYIGLLRGTPVVVLLMLIFYVVFASVNISPLLVAVIAFGMNFAAYVSEIFRTGIEGVDKGQTEAGKAMGFSRLAIFRHIIFPQMLTRILPVYRGEFISMVKMTSIVGYIAVEDLTKASDIIRSRTFDAFFPLVMVAVLYLFIAWVLVQALEYLERAMDPKYRRRQENVR